MKLLNSLSRQVEELTPIDGERYRFYCCGPTVYAPAHIGNFRTFVIQDVFRRTLEVAGLKPYHVRNITDVDDKTIRDSQAEGSSLADFTKKWTARFHADCAALNMLPPHDEPSAVEHIPEQVAMIETLIEKGHAYADETGSVYFKVDSFDDYGELSRLKEREIRLGAASTDDETDADTVADFVLWKAWKDGDGPNKWASPWGDGRPGWHLECSAMIHKYLGTDFDLHSGGIDLQFPHHENEIAQSVCCHGGGFAKHWFHTTHLMVDGGKMSKSLNNFFTVADIEAAGFHALELRYALIAAYYRQPLNFVSDNNFASLSSARGALGKIAKLKDRLNIGPDDWTRLKEKGWQIPTGVNSEQLAGAWQSLSNDLNVPRALGFLFSANPTTVDKDLLMSILYALGLEADLPEAESVDVPDEITALADQRLAARAEKDWTRSDELRDQIAAAGWQIKDGADGYELTPL